MIDRTKWIGTSEIAELLGKPRNQVPSWLRRRKKYLGEPKKGFINKQEAHFWPRDLVMLLIAKGVREYRQQTPVETIREMLTARSLPVAIMRVPTQFSAEFMRGGYGA